MNCQQILESFYILWKTTRDVRWRERGWSIFEAIVKETKTASGFASIESVDTSPSPKRDEMPRFVSSLLFGISKHWCHPHRKYSYFLAEMLKYLYLLFSDD